MIATALLWANLVGALCAVAANGWAWHRRAGLPAMKLLRAILAALYAALYVWLIIWGSGAGTVLVSRTIALVVWPSVWILPALVRQPTVEHLIERAFASLDRSEGDR